MATAPATTQVNEAPEHTKPPFLRRVRIRGYKSIAFCDVPLQPLTILVGRNAAGKSNFLDALAFLRDAMETSVTEAVKRRGGWSSILCRTLDKPKIEIEVEAGFTCGQPFQRISRNGPSLSGPVESETPPNFDGISFTATYRLECVAEPHTVPPLRERLEISDNTNWVSAGFEVYGGSIERWTSASTGPLAVPYSATGAAHLRELLSRVRPDRLLLAVLGNQPFVDLGEGLRWMGFYNFAPDVIRNLQKPDPGWLLERDGRNLASVIESLKEIDADMLQRVRDYLSLIAEEVKDFDVVRYGEYETVRFRLKPNLDGSTFEFDAASMSDGTLRALAALMAAFQIHLPLGPSVVGIEEPEAALHPAAMRALVDALDDATQRTQILLTTHSADLLSSRDVTPGQVLVVRNRGGKTQITPVDPASREIVEKELYSLADLQRMDKLDLDEADLRRQIQLSQEGT